MKSMDVVTGLSALAQESRLALFRLLVRRGPEGFNPSQLADKLDVPGPTLSFHLKELQRAGLIVGRREGRSLFYSPNFSRMNELIGYLSDHCCGLADQDHAPEACAIRPAEVTAPGRKRA